MILQYLVVSNSYLEPVAAFDNPPPAGDLFSYWPLSGAAKSTASALSPVVVFPIKTLMRLSVHLAGGEWTGALRRFWWPFGAESGAAIRLNVLLLALENAIVWLLGAAGLFLLWKRSREARLPSEPQPAEQRRA
ncbi:MAG: hypothetical protein WCC53_15870 [Thermoanaerobaculia bacterium]